MLFLERTRTDSALLLSPAGRVGRREGRKRNKRKKKKE